jgi:signal transduction histidine kinase
MAPRIDGGFMLKRFLAAVGRLAASAERAEGFRLTRYFTLTSLAAFAVVGGALFVLERKEATFFAQVQREQAEFFARAQQDLTRAHEEAARNDLLAAHEAGHVNLARVFANVLWERDFAPFVARAQGLPADRCRALGSAADAASAAPADRQRSCFAELGRQIMELPGFAALDARAREAMRASNVFKIKVFDLRGITVYSSEHAQIGEDKRDNLGWQSAVQGKPASELTHRDRFSAFERVVENRDLISSYLPVHAPGSDRIVGVFEIYSDVTPLIEQIKRTSAQIAQLTAANQRAVELRAQENERRVEASSRWLLGIVGGLLALLYLSLLLIVRIGQRIIDRQAQAQARAVQREREWHREKMAALATMASAISHEVGNPLMTITLLAEEIVDGKKRGNCSDCHPEVILEQAWRIAQMTREMGAFASARSESREPVDVNRMAKAVCDFLRFDRRYRATPVEFRPAEDLPASAVIPDHLNEVLMNLVQLAVESAPARVSVETGMRGEHVLVRIGCEGPTGAAAPAPAVATDVRFEAAQRRIAEMGARLTIDEGAFCILLPAAAEHTAQA